MLNISGDFKDRLNVWFGSIAFVALAEPLGNRGVGFLVKKAIINTRQDSKPGKWSKRRYALDVLAYSPCRDAWKQWLE